ncbi:MAG: LCP family protein [Clostridiaceae bacterium]
MRERKKIKVKPKFYIFLTLFILLIIGGIVFGVYRYLLSLTNKSSGYNGQTVITKEVKKDGPVNILLMGVDIGDPQSKSANDPKRTDTLMLLNYNPNTKSANILSIPRDTLIKINGKNQKINNAHAINGIQGAIDAVEKLLEVDVNYYAKLNYEGFRKLIDSIGGVDITIPYEMDYDDAGQNLHIHFKKGETVHLDGAKAEEYFRWRKNNDGKGGFATGDLGRIDNQHDFISKVIDKIKSPSIIFKLGGILKSIPEFVETNMEPVSIIKYGYIVAKLGSSNIKMETIKSTPEYIDKISYVIYEPDKNKEILAPFREEGIGTSENKTLSIDKKTVKVMIENGTGTQGLAADVKEKLENKGYKNVTTGNAAAAETSKVTAYNMDEDINLILADEFGISNVDVLQSSNSQYDIVIILGSDYK